MPPLCPVVSFSPTIHDMQESQHRMMIQHARPRVLHDFPNPFAHGCFITMDRTPRTGRFVFPKRAFLNSFQCICLKGPTNGTDFFLRFMQISTIDPDHRLEGLSFTLDPAASPFQWHPFYLQISTRVMNSNKTSFFETFEKRRLRFPAQDAIVCFLLRTFQEYVSCS